MVAHLRKLMKLPDDVSEEAVMGAVHAKLSADPAEVRQGMEQSGMGKELDDGSYFGKLGLGPGCMADEAESAMAKFMAGDAKERTRRPCPPSTPRCAPK